MPELRLWSYGYRPLDGRGRTDKNVAVAEKKKAGALDTIGSFLSDQILYNKTVNSQGFTLHKQLADLNATTSLGFRQTLSFTPTPTVFLLLSTGQTALAGEG